MLKEGFQGKIRLVDTAALTVEQNNYHLKQSHYASYDKKNIRIHVVLAKIFEKC